MPACRTPSAADTCVRVRRVRSAVPGWRLLGPAGEAIHQAAPGTAAALARALLQVPRMKQTAAEPIGGRAGGKVRSAKKAPRAVQAAEGAGRRAKRERQESQAVRAIKPRGR